MKAISVTAFRWLAAALFGASGVLHFVSPESFIKIVPPTLPAPGMLVYISGAAEIAGAVGLLIPKVRTYAGAGLILLLIAVFPANIYLAVDRIQLSAKPLPVWAFWARLPLQFVLIYWVWAVSKRSRRILPS